MKQYIIPIGAAVLFAACSPAPPDVDLFEAASKGNLDAIKKHIAAGTDLNQKDPNPTGNKDDALGMAAAFGRTDVAKALIEAGANVSVDDLRNITAQIQQSSYYSQANQYDQVITVTNYFRLVVFYGAANGNLSDDVMIFINRKISENVDCTYQ